MDLICSNPLRLRAPERVTAPLRLMSACAVILRELGRNPYRACRGEVRRWNAQPGDRHVAHPTMVVSGKRNRT